MRSVSDLHNATFKSMSSMPGSTPVRSRGHPPVSAAFNTMTDLASHPPDSPRFRRNLPTLERRAGAWLPDFHAAAARPDFNIPAHLDKLAKPAQAPVKH